MCVGDARGLTSSASVCERCKGTDHQYLGERDARELLYQG